MPRNKFKISLLPSNALNWAQQWLIDNSFKIAEFQNGKFRELFGSYSMNLNTAIYYSLIENPGYVTFFNEGKGRSMLVIELMYTNKDLYIETYSSILIFGFIRKEYKFIESPSLLKSYLKEGYHIITEFQNYIKTKASESTVKENVEI